MSIQLRITGQLRRFTLSVGLLFLTIAANNLHGAELDHSYRAYSQLLQAVVQISADKKQSRVNYQLLADKKTTLDSVLSSFSAVSKSQFDSWSEEQKLSFLINVYNGFTLQLIVDNWDKFQSGDAKSIRDLGSFFTGPWEKKFFTLFGEKHNLDDIEHEMVRIWFKEPRIHAALVCAAVSCPPLRNSAFMADELDEQLDSQMRVFLADNSRNEFLVSGQLGEASLSSIFKWFRGDFEKSEGGFNSLYDLLSTYSEAIVQDDEYQQKQRELLKGADYPIKFKDYDWRLNDVANY
jgi:hypothetical protein